MLKLEVDSASCPDISATIASAYAQGIRHLILTEGVYSAPRSRADLLLLHNTRDLTIEAYEGQKVVLDGRNQVNHVMHFTGDSRGVVVKGIEITRGSTYTHAHPAEKVIKRKKSLYSYIDGAGVLVEDMSAPHFIRCHLHHNQSFMCGGAMSIQQTQAGAGWVEVDNCLIEQNIAGHTGSAVDVLTPGSKVKIKTTRFLGNRSNYLTTLYGPHGAISVFPHSFALLENNDFQYESGSSPAVDYRRGRGALIMHKNTFSPVGLNLHPQVIESGKDIPDLEQWTTHLLLIAEGLIRYFPHATPGIAKGSPDEVAQTRMALTENFGPNLYQIQKD